MSRYRIQSNKSNNSKWRWTQTAQRTCIWHYANFWGFKKVVLVLKFWNFYYTVQVIHISKVRFFIITNWHTTLRQPAFTPVFKIVLFNSSTECKEVAIVFHLLRKFITGQLCGENGVQMTKHQSIKFSRLLIEEVRLCSQSLGEGLTALVHIF